MCDTKKIIDLMYQADNEFNKPKTAIKNKSCARFQCKALEISPKSLSLKINNDLKSTHPYKTPRSITRRIKIRPHKHNYLTEKPLAKTFINPIIPKYHSFTRKERQIPQIPEFKLKLKNLHLNYMKYCSVPMTPNTKLKYTTVLDSFHFNY